MHPELKDPIYSDFIAELGIAEKGLATAKIELAQAKVELDTAVPQSGTLKRAQRKFHAAEKKVAILEQQIKYWNLRIASRKSLSRKRYLNEYYGGKKQDLQSEYAEYTAELSLRRAKMNWDAKERVNNYKNELVKKDRAPAAH